MSKPFSYANLSNLKFLEETHASWKKDPSSVDPSWGYFFEGWQFSHEGAQASSDGSSPELRIHYLINSYRTYGHLLAKFNPITPKPPEKVERLSLEFLGFGQDELTKKFPTCGFLKKEEAPLGEIVEALQKTYCRSVGVEYRGLESPELELWIEQRIEPFFEHDVGVEGRKKVLEWLNKAEAFESFIHTKYLGQKRFSLEGAETLIPMMNAMVEHAGELSMTDVIIGMAHRGRLNVLTNVVGKSYREIFSEFEDYFSKETHESVGDVKYHMGYEQTQITESGGKVNVSLAPNPSHLEAVNPVVEGIALRKAEKSSPKKVLPVLIHGDAALAGQGIIYETMQFGHLDGYGTGGTLHIVVNNQIGFTAVSEESRSTRYCTAIAKAFGAPVFHVNAEDPEGCVHAMRLALEIRQHFGIDVFIDLNAYRKYGHNEGDEPTFTQPLEYKIIRGRTSIRNLYRKALIDSGQLSEADAEEIEKKFRETLDSALSTARSGPPTPDSIANENLGAQCTYSGKLITTAREEKIRELAQKFSQVPEGFSIHPKLKKLVEKRLAMLDGKIDWGMGEHLAYATLVDEGHDVRISGQDSCRATFSFRHARWTDQDTGKRYYPLQHLSEMQGAFNVYNSPLSEYGVLGFDWGYALKAGKTLTVWEAQYGDFANGAQIIFDQFLISAEQKWGSANNLTVLLPHGYEGGGSEHSSARIERFLQLAGDDNIIVANVTSPAQLFHLLRRQAKRDVRKPLILFTPKSTLRHPLNTSTLDAFTGGGFEKVLDDNMPAEKVKTLCFCSGKVYFDLIKEREERERDDIAFVRVEQLYPVPKRQLEETKQKYGSASKVLWVQEEHKNMGAWDFMRVQLSRIFGDVEYRGRMRSSVTAAGSHALHDHQQEAMMQEVFENE